MNGFPAWPNFDLHVVPGGYAWWYVDALSDDGRHGLTMIAFIGSVFSPYYAHARHRAAPALVDPLGHCSLNVALYGVSDRRWTMTERGAARVERTAATLRIGPSALAWDGRALRIDIDERGAPLPRAVRGIVTVTPSAVVDHGVFLDRGACHRWQPIAPCARIEVDLARPRLRWSGHAYVDSNHGDAPLEDAFSGWQWARASTDGDTLVTYDVERRDGGPAGFGRRFRADGRVGEFAPPPDAPLPASGWRVGRSVRTDEGSTARVRDTLEDGPFYARSLVTTHWLGRPVTAVHESLSLDRFARPWVRALLPFRMPRF